MPGAFALLTGLAVLAGLALRVGPRLGSSHGYASDTYFHLYFAREIRAHAFNIPRRLSRILLPHESTYPFGYHFVLAALPEGARAGAERLTGAIADGLAALVVAWFLLHTLSPSEPSTIAFTVSLFTLAPGLLRLASGPRAYWGSPRPVGQLLYVIHATTAFLATTEGDWTWFAATVAAGSLLVLTSKFSVQAMTFFSIGLGFVDPVYPALAAASVALALLAPGGRGWRVLVGHYKHSRFYYQHLQRVFVQRHVRTFGDYASATGTAWRALLRGQWRRVVHWLLGDRFPPHVFLFIFTPFLVALVLAVGRPAFSDLERFLLAWTGAAVVCFVATHWRPLMFLGDGERYLEYALLPAITLNCLWSGPAWGWLLLTYSAATAAYFFRAARTQSQALHRQFSESVETFQALDRLPPGCVMPIGSFHWQALYRCTNDVLTIGVNIDDDLLNPSDFHLVYGNFPYPSERFEEITKRFDVRYIVTDQAHLEHYTRSILRLDQPALPNTQRLAGAGGVLLLKVMKP